MPGLSETMLRCFEGKLTESNPLSLHRWRFRSNAPASLSPRRALKTSAADSDNAVGLKVERNPQIRDRRRHDLGESRTDELSCANELSRTPANHLVLGETVPLLAPYWTETALDGRWSQDESPEFWLARSSYLLSRVLIRTRRPEGNFPSL